MLQHKFFDLVPLLKPFVVLFDYSVLDPLLLFAVIIAELKISQEQFRLMIVFHLKFIPLIIVILNKFRLFLY